MYYSSGGKTQNADFSIGLNEKEEKCLVTTFASTNLSCDTHGRGRHKCPGQHFGKAWLFVSKPVPTQDLAESESLYRYGIGRMR